MIMTLKNMLCNLLGLYQWLHWYQLQHDNSSKGIHTDTHLVNELPNVLVQVKVPGFHYGCGCNVQLQCREWGLNWCYTRSMTCPDTALHTCMFTTLQRHITDSNIQFDVTVDVKFTVSMLFLIVSMIWMSVTGNNYELILLPMYVCMAIFKWKQGLVWPT